MAYTLTITIKFYDYWHCGSGNSGGNESDALVVRYDQGTTKGLPYVPAKTLKGLMREMAEVQCNCSELQRWFGNTSDKDNKCYKKNETIETETYLSNADIKEDIKKENIPFLFKTFKNTALEDGIAKDNSLREIETVVPLEVEAIFSNVIATDEEQLETLKDSICSIKRIGLNRNRGMGRCEVDVISKEEAVR
ncbi:MAG: DUF324 domain-containing protein [uncultured Sulfurovum sp.]|uniref:DUF324 domain-containing protein n=1 Tax=uncultured Sulfurovum sp. TaxID=269237 RepID=A0A6S6SBM3_9BACT|nr:MAG: DUF324 domain-containing protein [uncultured Sulfurovum sp.]